LGGESRGEEKKIKDFFFFFRPFPRLYRSLEDLWGPLKIESRGFAAFGGIRRHSAVLRRHSAVLGVALWGKVGGKSAAFGGKLG
jgi:hypothetical protein